MKYAIIDIDVYRDGEERKIKITERAIHKECYKIEYYKNRHTMNFIKCRSISSGNMFGRFGEYAGRIFLDTAQNDTKTFDSGMVMFDTPRESVATFNEEHVAIGGILELLYLFDKRCSRSVNIIEKSQKDYPLKLNLYGVTVLLNLKQMKLMLDFISNEQAT